MGWPSRTVKGGSFEASNSHLSFFALNREKSMRCSNLHQSFTASSPDISPSTVPCCMNYQNQSLPFDMSMMDEDTMKPECDRDDDMESFPTPQNPLSSTNVSTPERNASVFLKSTNWSIANEVPGNYNPKYLKETYSVSPTRRSLKTLSPGLRRKSLLPKPKMFQRVANALYEEASPWEIELRNESEFARMTAGSVRSSNANIYNPVHSSALLHSREKPQELPNIRKEKETPASPSAVAESRISATSMEKSNTFFSPAVTQTPRKRSSCSMTTNGLNLQSPKNVFSSPQHKENEVGIHSKKRLRLSEDFTDLPKRRAVSPFLYKFDAIKFSPVHSVKVRSLQVRDTHEVLRNLKLC
ncbi:double strand break localizing protein Dbl6 [Schizosaccharomyces osmophilus]|uniref:Double strand break localizing protein Dbl6 n=1 Tax=Schizosaccharomyces osmophilus TaxID=2545709 RepID=A0AAE9WD75_9SCHI|nr:double strand break localizing protein Dbl6 [Schizosaccharomyces osmophilus]WBW74201.1 double strand break localizing protein Dbl6 [Schizosaccharomyces osmophilus]